MTTVQVSDSTLHGLFFYLYLYLIVYPNLGKDQLGMVLKFYHHETCKASKHMYT